MKTRDLTIGGILVALSMLCFYAIYLLPTNTLTFFTLTAFMPPVAYLMTSLQASIAVYIATSILSFILFGPHIAIFYILFFGNYGIVKSFIEGINKGFLEFILKLVYFNVIFTIGYTIIVSLLLPDMVKPVMYITSAILPYITEYLPQEIAEVLVSSVSVVDTVSTTIKLILQFFSNILFLIFDYALSLLIWNFHKLKKKMN